VIPNGMIPLNKYKAETMLFISWDNWLYS